MPFANQSKVPYFIECNPDVKKPEVLKPVEVQICTNLKFVDRILPQPCVSLVENVTFPMQYFVDLHNLVKSYNDYNFKGARIPLAHNSINVAKFRQLLSEFEYPYIHIMQYIEFGFPLGLNYDAYLEPNVKNHSSAYSFYPYVDKFISSELENIGVTGPFERAPWDWIMISPIMTAPKKPDSRRTVFDASFGPYSINKNTPEGAYLDTEYEFSFPKIDNLVDIISQLGPGCFLWKRDLSRFFLQLKIDPYEYDRLGFVWRSNLYLFVSFVWGCRHAGYVGQWVTSAVSFIFAHLGIKLTGEPFNILNYADDFAGAENSLSRAEMSFNKMGDLLSQINLAESASKACPPSNVMTYLGVCFTTNDMCLYVDKDKLVEIRAEIKLWLKRSVAKKSELQSILGKLLWISKAVRFSRIFVSRIINEISKLEKQSDKVTLSRDICKDFLWWNKYIEVFTGVEFIPLPYVSVAIYGDACISGGGSWNPMLCQYFSLKFPTYMSSPDTPIHIKEFVVVILSVRLWGPQWTGQKVVIYCDNDAVCDTCTFQKPKDKKLQQLLREFLFWVCSFNFFPVLHKINTKDNAIADLLSRVYDEEIIDDNFKKEGYPDQSRILIPEKWFDFQADW